MLEESTGAIPTDMKLVFVNPTTNHREVFHNSMTLHAADFGILEKHDDASDLEPPFHLMLYLRDRNGQFMKETGVKHFSETDLTNPTDRRIRSGADASALVQPPVAVKHHNEPKDRPNDNLRDQSRML
ncbi:hypothetical protein RvY_07003 [Ramazzottius varieornatus]|uniref:Uncharacterized protein n=1 Tax=Ramazzottius varieornatus TaxID=947166 RepID=A0A1D1V3U3_RAMVA|nr:hypothetical protein RvY_07003 [Ramazzottius varieornatus]